MAPFVEFEWVILKMNAPIAHGPLPSQSLTNVNHVPLCIESYLYHTHVLGFTVYTSRLLAIQSASKNENEWSLSKTQLLTLLTA